jgi:hypothetical protein
VLGQTVILNGRALTIIGVMPPGIRFPERDDFWVAYRPSSDPSAPRRARSASWPLSACCAKA